MATNAGTGMNATVKRPPENAVSQFGMALRLLMDSPFHRKWRVGSVLERIIPPIALGQVRIVVKDDQPVGFLTWALFTESAENAYLKKHRKIKLEEWNAGDRLWFTDFVAPYGKVRKIIEAIDESLKSEQFYTTHGIAHFSRGGRGHRRGFFTKEKVNG
jgi:hemolysin-activating ACP:hemolysin acyltransferase